jgi:hypothetical protein
MEPKARNREALSVRVGLTSGGLDWRFILVAMEKHCGKCGLTKPIGDFYRERSRKDGHASHCKRCNNVRVNQWEKNHRDRVNAWSGARQMKYNRANPEKIRAHKYVQRAIKTGMLIRPNICEMCGKTARKLHAHHDDYTQPLQVDWLCSMCHAGLHWFTRAAA